MNVPYKYDSERNINHVHPAGTISLSTIEQYVQQVLEDRSIKKGFVEFVYLENVEDFDFSFNDARNIPYMFRSLVSKLDFKGSIIIGSNDYQFGIARMVSTLIQEYTASEAVRTVGEAEKVLKKIRSLP